MATKRRTVKDTLDEAGKDLAKIQTRLKEQQAAVLKLLDKERLLANLEEIKEKVKNMDIHGI